MTTDPEPIFPCGRCHAALDSPYLHAPPALDAPDGPAQEITCGLCGSLWTSHLSFEPPNLDPTPEESVARFEQAEQRADAARQALDDARRHWQLVGSQEAAASYFGAFMRAGMVAASPGAWIAQLSPALTMDDILRAIRSRSR